MTWLLWFVVGWAVWGAVANGVKLFRIRQKPPVQNLVDVIDVDSVSKIADWRIEIYDKARNVWVFALVAVVLSALLLWMPR